MNYRINTYEYGFVIEKRQVAGDKSKTPGEERWVPYKYPGNLEQACQLLLELLVRDEADHEAINNAIALQKTVTKSVGAVKRIARRYAEAA